MSKETKNNDFNRTRGIVDVLQESGVAIPPLLYKYYAIDEWTERIFKNTELYFSSPVSFNDPFDSKISFIYAGSRNDRKRFLKKWSEVHRPDLPRKDRLGYEKRIRKQGLDIQAMAPGIQKKFMAARRRMGVFCMTEDRENILMWSHYATEHKGFCIEFRTDNAFFSRARAVQYDITVPCVNLLEPWDNLITKGAVGLLTKAEDWRYEKEWRIVKIDGTGVQICPAEALSGVILGCRMLAETKRQIKEWCRECQSRPTLYEAKEKAQEFGLDIVPLT
jgi:hypothetical protein